MDRSSHQIGGVDVLGGGDDGAPVRGVVNRGGMQASLDMEAHFTIDPKAARGEKKVNTDAMLAPSEGGGKSSHGHGHVHGGISEDDEDDEELGESFAMDDVGTGTGLVARPSAAAQSAFLDLEEDDEEDETDGARNAESEKVTA